MTFADILWTIRTIGMTEDQRHDLAVRRNSTYIAWVLKSPHSPAVIPMPPAGLAADEWASVHGHIHTWYGHSDSPFIK